MGWREMTASAMKNCVLSFGESVTYIPGGLSPLPMRAIFDQDFQQVDPLTGALVISSRPMIGVQLSDLPKPAEIGDRVFVRGLLFRVIEMQSDGQAGTKLLLQRVSP